MEVTNKYYNIQYKTEDWHNLDDIEYTEKEANSELRRMRRNSRYPLRKKYIKTQVDVILVVNPNLYNL